MVYKKKPVPVADRAVVLADKLLADIDAEVLLAGVLGGIATAGGIMPPLTRILIALGGSAAAESTVKDLTDIWALGPFFAGPLWIQQMLTGAAIPSSTTTANEAQQYAIVASGALEAMITMSFAKNPKSMEMISSAIGKIPVVLPAV